MSRRLLKRAFIAILVIVFVILPFYVAWESTGRQVCEYTATPPDVGLEKYRETVLQTPDGIRLSTWIIPPTSVDNGITVILMHGYTSCKSHPKLLELAKNLANMGSTVVMFDFRAHGNSGGDKTSIGPWEVTDAKTVLDYVVKEFPQSQIVLVGFSMGGAVAYVLGSQSDRVDAVVADSPYYILKDVIPRWIGAYTPLPSAYGRLIGLYGSLIVGESLDFGPAKVNPPVNKPIIIIFGNQDPLVKSSEMRELASKSPCGEAHEFKNVGHVEAIKFLGAQAYARIIIEAVQKPCPPG